MSQNSLRLDFNITEHSSDTFVYRYDNKGYLLPPDDTFVLSRDAAGKAVSYYGDLTWDFYPYQSCIDSTNKVIFNCFGEKKVKANDDLMRELKWLLFIIFFFKRSRQLGCLSINTILGYAYKLKSLCHYAQEKKITLSSILSDKATLEDYVASQNSQTVVISIASILQLYFSLGAKTVGFESLNSCVLQDRLQKVGLLSCHKQTPVIPTRIFSAILTKCHKSVNQFFEVRIEIKRLLQQVLSKRTVSGKHEKYKVINLLICSDDSLSEYFSEYDINNIRQLMLHIRYIQTVCKVLIHAYSGMRHSEVLSLKYNCLEIVKKPSGKVARLLGITTKLSPPLQRAQWVTSIEIEKAITVLQSIAFGVAKHKNINLIDCPLFISISYYVRMGARIDQCGRNMIHGNLYCSVLEDVTKVNENILIESKDIKELEKIDPFQDWRSQEKFQVGEPWPLASHQFRRSLAIYVAQSGLVSIPSLKRQLKHITKEMTLYYSSGASEAEPLFGTDHISDEIQRIKPEADALAYIQDVLLSDEILWGGHGRWAECHERSAGKLTILANREKTIKLFKNGLMAYQETPLGACTTVSPCNKKAIRAITACISCANAVIKPSKLDRVINAQNKIVQTLNPMGMEYKIERDQLDELQRLKSTIKIKLENKG